jgi:hypothetical protein
MANIDTDTAAGSCTLGVFLGIATGLIAQHFCDDILLVMGVGIITSVFTSLGIFIMTERYDS